jgi:hypothetical protein
MNDQDRIPSLYPAINIGCVYRGCRNKNNIHFCTTRHAILDYLDAYGEEELMKIIDEWRKKNE